MTAIDQLRDEPARAAASPYQHYNPYIRTSTRIGDEGGGRPPPRSSASASSQAGSTGTGDRRYQVPLRYTTTAVVCLLDRVPRYRESAFSL